MYMVQGTYIKKNFLFLAEASPFPRLVAHWSPWSPWSPCSSSCGGVDGVRARFRLCSVRGGCAGAGLEEAHCRGEGEEEEEDGRRCRQVLPRNLDTMLQLQHVYPKIAIS